MCNNRFYYNNSDSLVVSTRFSCNLKNAEIQFSLKRQLKTYCAIQKPLILKNSILLTKLEKFQANNQYL